MNVAAAPSPRQTGKSTRLSRRLRSWRPACVSSHHSIWSFNLIWDRVPCVVTSRRKSEIPRKSKTRQLTAACLPLCQWCRNLGPWIHREPSHVPWILNDCLEFPLGMWDLVIFRGVSPEPSAPPSRRKLLLGFSGIRGGMSDEFHAGYEELGLACPIFGLDTKWGPSSQAKLKDYRSQTLARHSALKSGTAEDHMTIPCKHGK